MPLYHFLLIFSISHIFSYLTSVYVYSFTANGISIIYNSHSRMDDDTEADISSTDDSQWFLPTNHGGYIIPFPIFHIISPVNIYILLQRMRTQ